MTTIELAQTDDRTMARSAWAGTRLRRLLLLCGVFSSVVYLSADVVGGARYPGYSFTSQAVSELMAAGAPSEAFVDPLFLTYGVLALAFGAAVFREGIG